MYCIIIIVMATLFFDSADTTHVVSGRQRFIQSHVPLLVLVLGEQFNIIEKGQN